MRPLMDKAKRLVAKYGTAEAACWAIEDRAIRCKTARCESRLFYLAEAVDLLFGRVAQ